MYREILCDARIQNIPRQAIKEVLKNRVAKEESVDEKPSNLQSRDNENKVNLSSETLMTNCPIN